ncbi:MAG: phytoene desaturase family protein [Pseudomonadota bacterium]
MTIAQDHDPFLAAAATATSADGRPHAIVIGAGFGGLAAACRLGARGYRVTIVEALEQVGGRASVFKQDGYTFDAGPTIITAPFVFEELWQLFGEDMHDHIDLKALEPYYAVRFGDGQTFRCWSDPDKMRKEIAAFEPSDVAGYDDYLVESEKCFQTGFVGMIDKPFHTLGRMAAAMPGLIARRADRSVHALVGKFIKNKRLQQALDFHPLFIGGNPMRASGVLSLIAYLERHWGVHYAMGGTGALVRGIADLLERHGHTILLNAPVDEITVEEGRATGVALTNGITIPADVVVSNADTGFTYTKLLRNHPRKRWTDRKVKRMAYSMSLFVWYFGTDKRWEDVDHHTILMGPRYEGLLKDIFDKKVLADDFSLYLYRPSASDPSVAPEGCDAFYVLSPVPNLKGDVDWDDVTERYRQRIADALDASVLPGLNDAIVTSKVVTPHYFKDRLSSTNGNAFGMEPLLWQLAWFRPHNVSEEIKDLYIVGAGTHPGAGLPGVVSSAKILDKLVPDGATVKAR